MEGGRIASNRKARHDYTVLRTVEAGLVLVGTEVKALRAHKVSLTDSFARVERDGAFLYNVQIEPYEHGHQFNHEPRRVRRLLLHRQELLRLGNETRQRGLTLVPLALYFTKRGFAKVELALAKGKRQYDKRESLKRREQGREMDRAKRGRGGRGKG